MFQYTIYVINYTSPMQDIVARINRWLSTQPNWVHKLASLFDIEDVITQTQIEELIGLALDEVRNKLSYQRTPITFTRLNVLSAKVPVALEEISNIQNVNALSSGSNIIFPTDGVIVIYGDNGSGKSGIVRVIKRISGRNVSLLPNVYTKNNEPMACRIKALIDGNSITQEAKIATFEDPYLSSIQIFDESTAQHFRLQERELSLSPPLLEVFDRIIAVAEQMRNSFQSEIHSLSSTLPQPPSDLHQINHQQPIQFSEFKSPQALISYLQWTDIDEQNLVKEEALQQSIAVLPTTEQLKARIRSLETFCNFIQKLKSLYSEESIIVLTETYNLQQDQQKAVNLLSELTQRESLLPNFGNTEWSILWSAAKSYIESIDQPDIQFPPKAGDLCALCQQSLSNESAVRLQTFDQFLKSELSEKLLATKKKFAMLTDTFQVVESLQLHQDNASQFPEGAVDKPFLSDLMSRIRVLDSSIKLCEIGEWKGISALDFDSIILKASSTAKHLSAQLSLMSDPEAAKRRQDQIVIWVCSPVQRLVA